MGRLRLYTSDQILDGARGLVLGEGIAAATIGNIARASGAPPGSIYYRFDSRETLLAELWIRAVERAQRLCLAAVEAAGESQAACRSSTSSSASPQTRSCSCPCAAPI